MTVGTGNYFSSVQDSSDEEMPINFVIVALTHDELLEIVEVTVPGENDEKNEWLEEYILCSGKSKDDLLSRYGSERTDWKPLLDNQKNITEIIEDVCDSFNKQSSTKKIKATFIFNDEQLENKLIGLNKDKDRCVVIIDPISIFHPHLCHNLSRSPLLSDVEHVSLILVCPIDPSFDKLMRSSIESRLYPVHQRYEFDDKCEMCSGNLPALNRKLRIILDQKLKNIPKAANAASVKILLENVKTEG